MSIVKEVFYYTGGLIWLFIACVGSLMLSVFVFKRVLQPFWHGLQNLHFFLFGKNLPEGITYLEIWDEKYSHRPKIREHWKSWSGLRRLAYIRLLKEAKKELHSRKEDSK